MLSGALSGAKYLTSESNAKKSYRSTTAGEPATTLEVPVLPRFLRLLRVRAAARDISLEEAASEALCRGIVPDHERRQCLAAADLAELAEVRP